MTSQPGEPHASIRTRYLEFAAHEAGGRSPLYTELSRAVAESDSLLEFVATLPEEKRQPNLVLAAVRHLCGTPRGAAELIELVTAHADEIRHVVLERSTQTNEPGRCATLLPALAMLPQPLALLEVGASAGLCLLPDRYGYDFGRLRIEPPIPDAPVFPCSVNDAAPLPDRVPTIAWRMGVDLAPVDLSAPDRAAWLETLVWPGKEGRAQRLRAAIRVARRDPPPVIAGDLLRELPALAARAPRNATLVVFHSAVLAYLSPGAREHFRSAVSRLDAVWISNESPEVFPDVAERSSSAPSPGRFLLAMDGRPLAATDPHGGALDWFG